MKKLFLFLLLVGCASPKSAEKSPPAQDFTPLTINLHDKAYSRYLVQNLASMVIRGYYKPCALEESCPAFMVFEAPMVIGKDEAQKQSILGSFFISRWVKFYSDLDNQYLPWNIKPPPAPGANRADWGRQGAFGWYAAILEPGAAYQWLHGTIGWGKDNNRYIDPEISPSGAVLRIKSKGCTRVGNASIAFIRNFFPEKTPVFKIYAKEEILEIKPYVIIPDTWDYILSKDKKDPLDFPLENFNTTNVWESGRYLIDSKPDALTIKNKADWLKNELKTNPYEVPTSELGIFYINIGKVDKNYKHPKKLLKNHIKLPNYFIFNTYEIPSNL